MKQDIPGLAYEGIELVSREFCENPFMYLYEADLQSRLKSVLEDLTKAIRVSLDARYRKPVCYGGRTEISTSIVKAEYPSIGRFDIALIDAERPLRHAEGMTNDVFWTQPVRVGIEIKYWQAGESKRSRLDDLQDDLNKLALYNKHQSGSFLGIALLFIQSHTDMVRAADAPMLNELVAGLHPHATGIVGHIIGVMGNSTIPYRHDERGAMGVEPTVRGGKRQ